MVEFLFLKWFALNYVFFMESAFTAEFVVSETRLNYLSAVNVLFYLYAVNYISGFDVLPPQKGLDPRARLSGVDRRAEEEVEVPDARTVHRPKDRKTP